MSVAVDQSYRLGHFRDNAGSLQRLKRQAGIVLDLEFQHLRQAGLQDGAAILDMGCGPGIVSAELYKRAQPSLLIAGDCNETSLSETRAQFAAQGFGRNAEVREINIYSQIPQIARGFDFVYSRLVFQHLSEPTIALLNLQRALAPGGRVCICDIDDRWLSVSPSTPATENFISRVNKAQDKRGGDRNIGLKLPEHMARAGFRDIRVTTLLVSTDLIGKEEFCDLVFGYKLEVIPDCELAEAREEVRGVRESVLSPGGWGGVAVFFISGSAPEIANA